MQDDNNRETCKGWEGDIWEATFFVPFFCKPKTIVKITKYNNLKITYDLKGK